MNGPPPERRFLNVGDAVPTGPPVYCHMPTGRGGHMCGGYVGAPAVGAVLLAVMDLEAGERIERIELGLWALRCCGCGRHFLFSEPCRAAA